MEITQRKSGVGKAVVIIIVIFAILFGTMFGVKAVMDAKKAEEEAARIEAERAEAVGAAIVRADRIAKSYDYDGAILAVEEMKRENPEDDDKIAEETERIEAAVEKYQEQKRKAVRFADTTRIPHIFFHSLIYDTDLAFDGDYDSGGYNQFMTTVSEFRAIIEELYRRDYVLVNVIDIAKEVDGKFVQGDIMLPKGKKPIVISQDDLNYYDYMTGDGFARKLVVRDGELVEEYIEKDGSASYGEYDLVSILGKFVEEHPDFSYRGAKATLAITGYEGVLGYRTQEGSPNRESEIEEAKKVVKVLREKGWEFASHSYGHIGMRQSSVDRVKRDNRRWADEVGSILGKTEVMIYPYGQDIAGVEAYSGEKFEDFMAQGFRYFCNVDGSVDYWVQVRDGYVRQARRNVDGYRMYYNPNLLDDLFEVDEVFDKARPTPVPPI